MPAKTYKQALAVLRQHTVHEAANLFPMIGEADLKDLAADIAANGQQEPIWTDDDGAILDGRNRLVACTMAGVTPRVEPWDRRPGDTPVTFVLSKNLHRRHLTASQRAAVAVEMEPLIAAENERQRALRRQAQAEAARASRDTAPPVEFSALPPRAQGRARDLAARAVGVSAGYVNDAKDLRHAAPEMFEQVKTGQVTLPRAQEQVVERAQATGTPLDQVRLRPGTVRAVLDRQEKAQATRKSTKPKPRIRLPKFSKVASSRTTIQATITFGNAKVAEEWLNRLQDDPRCLDLSFKQVPAKPPRRTKSAG